MMMEPLLSKIASFVLVVSVASMTATGYICHYRFGLSGQEIRTEALKVAAVIAALVILDHFGRKARKP